MLHLSNIFIVVLLLSFRPFHSKGQTLKIKSSPSGITYVKKGETLTLDVTFTYTGNKTVEVAWWFGKLYERKIIERDVAGSTNSFDRRASIKDTASLVLTNTMVTDNGTYGIRLTVGDVPNDAEEQFTVIINEQPTAETNCTDITVDQGTDVTCRCFNKSGNPPPTASWSKSGVTGTIGGEGYLEKILSLKNVSASDGGTYVCNLQSHDLTDQVSIELKVKSAPDVASFEVDTEDVVLGMSTTITCEAIGFPEPTYTISHNGTVVQNGTTYIIKAVRYEDSGQYECVASNSRGNSSKRLTLIVKESSVSTKCSDTTEWYLILIAFLFGILSGIIILFSIQWLKRKLNRQENNPTYPEAGRMSKNNDHKCVDNVTTYAELNLQTRNVEDNYEHLRNKSRHEAKHIEAPAAQESNYQELMDVNGLDSNYQSLNRS